MSTQLITTDTTPTAATALCEACPHPAAAHDATSRRYCAATTAAASARGCICAGQ
ncbi:RGCVC family protein [Jatrophihabitans sp. YIM 134969]